MIRKNCVAGLAVLALLVSAQAASARPDRFGSAEMFPGEGVTEASQHGMTEGHLPPVSQGVKLIGKAEVTNPAGSGNDGRVADVSAYGKYAFLTAFREPTCERAGAHVIDMSDPKHPFEVTSAFMETTPFNYAGEGSDTLRLKNQYFDGVLFIHQNETCPGAPAPTRTRTTRCPVRRRFRSRRRPVRTATPRWSRRQAPSTRGRSILRRGSTDPRSTRLRARRSGIR